tara:strand:- start:1575 stop:2429 length:855 start_codon:yes stop_codon:yes gene_type:complete
LKFFFKNLKKLFSKNREVVLISSDRDLLDHLNEIFSTQLIAIDTEFDWRDTYLPKLSLIQICNLNKIYLIDFLYIKNKSNLLKKFEEEDKTFIFHSVRSDTTVLSSNMKLKLQNVFDIQIAEKILSGGNIENYGSIVNKYTNIILSKNETLSNWLKRPLTKEQIKYAANDVNFLIDIYKRQKKILKEKNLLQKAITESKQQANLGNQEIYKSRLKRIKLNNEEKKLFMWREKIAHEKNIPISYIFKDKHIKPILSKLKAEDRKGVSKFLSDSELTLRLIKDLNT